MNIENMYVQSILMSRAAERIYKVAYLLPPAANAPRNQAFTIKLPVPTVLLNAQLLVEIIQTTPTSHRMVFMDQLQPLLNYMIAKWQKLSSFTTLEALQYKTEEILALRQVTLLLHTIYPTTGLPGERVAAPGFSLGASSDQFVVQKASILSHRFNELARDKGRKLYAISAKYDLQIAENLNRADPLASWDMANPTVFAQEPQLCFMPLHVQAFQQANPNVIGHYATLGKEKCVKEIT